ncbi:PocR ligand-binding domain-containing protein [Clostridium sp. WILCCON 0269]|uniref:histidine kinase n=1 Tax=Candidatus Clostridium eludens TaxID=3381663 RepID=A0ABW8SPS0_9CLOT
MGKLKFSELINVDILKTMSENLYIYAGIQFSIIDEDGTVHVAVGLQDICTKYHRANPVTCERCNKGNNYIKNHLKENTYVAYKCQNNMWDIAMPVIISDKHVATVFVGQFFYEDEVIDEKFFREQAQKLGFDEEGYIAAFRQVPVVSKNKVKYIVEYYTGFVTMLAESGYRLLKYKRSQEELEKSQQYFKTILDSVNDAIIIFDIKSKVIDVNKTTIVMFGYSKKELLNMTRLDLISNNSPHIETNNEELIKKMRKCNPLILENIIIDKQGKETWAEANHHLTTIDGKERIVVAVRDITERKQIELLKLNQTLELEKLRTEFFANISHELRTPLNIILSSNQMIRKYIIDEDKSIDRKKVINYLNAGKQNCFRLLRLINNLIDVTKVDSGLFEVNLINCNIVNIIEEITLSTAEYVAANNLNLIFDTDVEEKIIACDPDKIERIILNLLSNCIKFTDKGGSIFVNVIDEEDYITIVVEDTGIGIPKEKLNLIFERFRQVDKSIRRNHEGSGIGLSLVKSLIEMQGGNISVESEYKKGTKFTIRIPIRTVNLVGNEKYIQYNNGYANNFVERINIEFSDIYK